MIRGESVADDDDDDDDDDYHTHCDLLRSMTLNVPPGRKEGATCRGASPMVSQATPFFLPEAHIGS
jgi:hypothetical protein